MRNEFLPVNGKLARFAFFTLLGAACAIGDRAFAAFEVASHTIDGGGGRSAGPTFVVTGSIGQPDAEPLQPSVSASGRFSATGGFWSVPKATMPRIFHDGFE
jgi:hypothetical protein